MFCIAVAVWGIGGLGVSLTPTSSYNLSLFWWQVGYIGVIFTVVFFFRFIISFLKLPRRTLLFFVYFLSFIFLFFLWYDKSKYCFGDLRWVFNQFYWVDWIKRRNPLWLVFYVSFYWILLGYAFCLLVKEYKCARGLKKTQLKYFIVGSIVGWLGAELVFLPAFHIDIYPYSNFLIAIYPFIFTYAIIKYHLMDIRIAITRTGIFLTLYALVLGVPFCIGYKTKSWVLSTLSAVILATIGPIVYRILQRKAEDILLAKQRHYQHLLLQAAGGMTREHHLERLLKLIVYIVKKIVKVEFAAIYSHNREKDIYELKSIRDGKTTLINHFSLSSSSLLVSYIRQKRSPFILEEAPSSVKEELNDLFASSLGLVIPSLIEDNLLGFLILGEKLDRTAYSQDDINVFSILSHQASLAMENCIFFDEFKKAQDRIFEAEKLASIGGMADGLAHQIKNRLNHFSVASGELRMEIEDLAKRCPQIINDEHLKASYDYIIQIADSLLENVRRSDEVVKGILNYSRTQEKDTYFSFFSLKETVKVSVDLLKIKHRISSFSLEEDISCDVVYGIKSQMSEVIYNLLDNAYEATLQKRSILSEDERKKYSPRIRIFSRKKDDGCLIGISDNGVGIKEEDRLKIFAPFFTTKSSFKPLEGIKSGTGIGMYIVKRLVEENHGGKIWFESDYMKGTTFYIILPFKKSSGAS